MDSLKILVIILSVTLFVLLSLSIFATVIFIKLLKKLSIATDSARNAVENVEAITDTLKTVANGSMAAGIVNSIWEKLRSKSKKGK
jgi:hypothetical protein